MLDLTTETARQTSPGQLTDIDLESWLEPAPEPARRVIWRPGWGQAVPVRSIEHLTVVMSATALEDFGGLCLDGDDGSRWTQAKRLVLGWIVEVRDATTDEWPDRVFRGSHGSYIRAVVPHEACAQEHFTTSAAAQLVWTWLATGALPEGYSGAVPVD